MSNKKPRPVDLTPVIREVDAAHDALDEKARDAPAGDVPDALSPAMLQRTWTKVQQLKVDREGLAARERELDARAQELEAGQATLNGRIAELEQQAGTLAKDEQAVRAREIELAAGLREERSAALSELDDEIAKRHQLLSDLVRGYSAKQDQQRTDLDAIEQRRTTAFERDLETHRATVQADLDAQRAALDADRKLVKARERQLAYDESVRDDTRAAIRQQANAEHAAEHERLTNEVARLDAQYAQAAKDRDTAERDLRAANERLRGLEQGSPQISPTDLEALRERCQDLERQLEARPTREEMADLEQVLRDLATTEQQLSVVTRERAKLDAALKRTGGYVATVEALESEKQSLETANATLKEALAERKRDFEELIDQQSSRSPFERLMEIEKKPLGFGPPSFEPKDLASFVGDLQQRIASNPPREGVQLFYSRHDLRLFLAGLATSRLMLLQGISGTGKTSLPLAFARAVGGGSNVVEVQAGWRDRQDLLGHYNTFERRYDETKFVQALFRAQTEDYAQRLYLVVLDEMNLSHPEQYFADLLSALENGENTLTLTNTSLSPAPRGLPDGRILKIPDNVWFIGTANHDETTKDFADKTYDRSHVQELPSHHPTFTVQAPAARGAVSLASLSERFADACGDHSSLATTAMSYLRTNLATSLADDFNIGWGNRLDEQLKVFVPVVVASGGTLAEAVDHILATKILRKVRGRHDISAQDVKDLQQMIATTWNVVKEGPAGQELEPDEPNRTVFEQTTSFAILQREQRWLSAGFG